MNLLSVFELISMKTFNQLGLKINSIRNGKKINQQQKITELLTAYNY